MMTSSEIRKRFLTFFEKRGHIVIPSASLVPENDPSVLFNTAGMQPLIPYLLGETHPKGNRLVNSQKCVRTQDIDEVGDNTHDTFFEMLGNWSLGSYWKKEAIEWSYEFLTSAKEGLGLNPERLFVTCFEGDSNAPRDEESATIWREIFNKNSVKGERIYYRPANKNWWSVGDDGPCGPDSEMFYDLTGEFVKGMTLEEYLKADDEQKIVEIWNDVFMEYLKKDGKVVGKLERQNVDTGSGFERVVMAVQNKTNIFDTDLFSGVVFEIRKHATHENIRSERIVSDHIRTACFIISDGVTPSNTDRGYILRRLLRRAVRHSDKLGLPESFLGQLVPIIAETYSDVYPEIHTKTAFIISEINNEENKFRKTLGEGLKRLEKIMHAKSDSYQSKKIGGMDAFLLFSTYGFPFELTKEIAQEKAYAVDEEGFQAELLKHQDLSRSGASEKFKGGLAGTGEMETKYHTATHLLHQALRDVLGDSVEQRGSNITAERLRFDFAFERKMTDDEKKRVEETVNEKIKLKLPVNKIIMKKSDAEKTGALHFFGDKYGDEVNVYYIGDNLDSAYSKEFCGGPHVTNTEVLGNFRILKEEAVSAGVRRIKAVLE
jgi:alanyl-tRNA synthetase